MNVPFKSSNHKARYQNMDKQKANFLNEILLDVFVKGNASSHESLCISICMSSLHKCIYRESEEKQDFQTKSQDKQDLFAALI